MLGFNIQYCGNFSPFTAVTFSPDIWGVGAGKKKKKRIKNKENGYFEGRERNAEVIEGHCHTEF